MLGNFFPSVSGAAFAVSLALLAFGLYRIAVYKPAAAVAGQAVLAAELNRARSHRVLTISTFLAAGVTSWVAFDLYRDETSQTTNVVWPSPWLMLIVSLFAFTLLLLSIRHRKGNSWRNGVWILGAFMLFAAAVGVCGGTFGMASTTLADPVWTFWDLGASTAVGLFFVFVPYTVVRTIVYYGERQRSIGANQMEQQMTQGVYAPPTR